MQRKKGKETHTRGGTPRENAARSFSRGSRAKCIRTTSRGMEDQWSLRHIRPPLRLASTGGGGVARSNQT